MLYEYHVLHSFRYYPRLHVTAVALGTYYPWIRGHACISFTCPSLCFCIMVYLSTHSAVVPAMEHNMLGSSVINKLEKMSWPIILPQRLSRERGKVWNWRCTSVSTVDVPVMDLNCASSEYHFMEQQSLDHYYDWYYCWVKFFSIGGTAFGLTPRSSGWHPFATDYVEYLQIVILLRLVSVCWCIYLPMYYHHRIVRKHKYILPIVQTFVVFSKR
jgi:hypothetical protein